MYFPQLSTPRQSRVTVSRFLGLDRRPRGQEGSFREMENLCADGYPTLTVRRPRGVAGSAVSPGGLTVKEGLIWVDGHTLYINGSAAGLVLSEGRKQLISMGAWLLIWPDKAYINTKDLTDFGSLENKRVTEGEVSFALCRPDGTVYSGYLAADEAPEEPEAGSLWLDTGGDETALRQYGEDGWTAVDDVCVRMNAAGIGIGFTAGDGVAVSGCRETALNGSFPLRSVEDDYVVVTALPRSLSSQSDPVTVERSVPDMDYVVESGNRLWGCKYGIVNGQAVNAIYASKLGDFKTGTAMRGCLPTAMPRPAAPTGPSPERRIIWGIRCFQGKLRGTGISQRQRRPSDRDGAVRRGEVRQQRQPAGGGRKAVLPQPGRRVRV